MNFSYRGIKYQAKNTTVLTKNTDTTIQYRGNAYQLKQVSDPIDKNCTPLTYRGVKYNQTCSNSSIN